MIVVATPHAFTVPANANFSNSSVDWLERSSLVPTALEQGRPTAPRLATTDGTTIVLTRMTPENYKELHCFESEGVTYETAVGCYLCDRCLKAEGASASNPIYTHPSHKNVDVCQRCVTTFLQEDRRVPSSSSRPSSSVGASFGGAKR